MTHPSGRSAHTRLIELVEITGLDKLDRPVGRSGRFEGRQRRTTTLVPMVANRQIWSDIERLTRMQPWDSL